MPVVISGDIYENARGFHDGTVNALYLLIICCSNKSFLNENDLLIMIFRKIKCVRINGFKKISFALLS